MKKLILGSSSPARQTLLKQLKIPFEIMTPDIDETPQAGETASKLVKRLSKAKAEALIPKAPGAILITCDQVGDFEGEILGKPLIREAAHKNLSRFSGKSITFHSGLCVTDTDTHKCEETIIETVVTFRELSDEVIDAYLNHENALNCAGGLKVEGFGITLLESVKSDDQSALIGLPLIALCSFLDKQGYSVFKAASRK
ncbi:MAG: septum formation protein Maf [Legionellales bacterium]|nr:septum formation protein Maf [Legionellales bacterium]|tara:strand:+ start:225 stop:821 length:597 start_codon:yes stop_codon:yes gene_type:complete